MPLQPPNPTSVVRVDLTGPQTVAPGGTAAFTATAHLADGTTRDVTQEAAWRSSAPSVLSIANGLAVAHERGDAFVTASFSYAGSTREVIVLPESTYRLSGIVTESPTAAAVLADALVEVTAGVGAGLSTTTDQAGRYRLFGVADGTEIRVTKPGFHPHTLSVAFPGHQALNITLNLVGPRVDVSGTYVLTITAAEVCRQKLRDDLRSRTYAVRLMQGGPLLDAILSGSDFAVSRAGSGNRFRGRVEPGGVSFTLAPPVFQYYGYEQYPDLVEMVPGGYVIIDGVVVLEGLSSHLAGTLTGTYQFRLGDPAWGSSPSAECRGDHPFVLSRTGS